MPQAIPAVRTPLTAEFTEPDATLRHRLSVHVVLFDLDGTLVESDTAIHRHTVRWAHRHALDPGHVLRVSQGRRDIDFIHELVPHADADAELAWFDQLSVTDSAGIEPTAGARDLLAALPAGSWAVVTSATRPVADSRLAAAGLPAPEVLVCAGDVADGKPSPQGYLAAARRFGVDPAGCLVIEDSDVGLLAARAAGMPALAVAGPRTPVHGQRITGLEALSVRRGS
ncbi:Phosphoglycolate phosphatase [Streptomyces sp. RB5]|uniref:Phosphoglycolate phosphatase n=1 Tax=Streptomyces smaragdinus TaxID=2585196 RepID=A0A7K0CNC1_9ACTN|nr:HAD-IA family hydrolase [Streptomyces smaragdinus]MQY14773.1 Phosphoglycolate phosphatase [Streptomyces smaragdinus]